MIMPNNYHLAPCPVCEGYNHECEACDGFGEMWVCDKCNGTGMVQDFGERVWIEWTQGYAYPNHKPPVPCPQCNQQPLLKIEW